MTDYFLGCDGGGTKTALAVLSSDGAVVARLETSTTYYLTGADITVVRTVLEPAIQSVCSTAGITPSDLRFSFFGLPGFGEVRTDTARIEALVRQSVGSDRFACDNDMVCAWAGSLGGADGINVISGTGSMTYGRRGDRGVRVGGWGEVFGDEGSGYWLGVAALRAFSKMSDGRSERGPLHGVMRRHLDIDEDVDAIDIVLNRWDAARTPIAALSRAVGEAARSGDAYASALLAQAADELVRLVEATRQRLGFAEREAVPVSYSGGVFAMDEVRRGFRLGLDALDARYELRDPLYPPDTGAAIYAATLGALPLGPDALSRLRRQSA